MKINCIENVYYVVFHRVYSVDSAAVSGQFYNREAIWPKKENKNQLDTGQCPPMAKAGIIVQSDKRSAIASGAAGRFAGRLFKISMLHASWID